MISYLLTVCGVLEQSIGLIATIVEAISVIMLCAVRIYKMIMDIKKAMKDDNPDDAKQLEDIVKDTVKDLKDTVKGDSDKDDKG